MYRIVLLLLLTVLSVNAGAQRIEKVKSRLAAPATGDNGSTARIRVNESGTAAESVRRGEASQNAQSANGFRIVVFFDNGISARSEAERIKAAFTESYPDIRCDIRYENPYFKLLAGNCVTSEEAVILLGRIRASYPEAYIMREEIPMQNFVTPKPLESNELPESTEAAAEE